MAPYKGWKELERRHAKRMSGKRLWRPDYGDSIPDGENEVETWDAKYSIHPVALLTIFDVCERKYREFTDGRNFHMVFYSKSKSKLGDIVACTAARYAELLAKEELLDSQIAAFISVQTPSSRIIHGDATQEAWDAATTWGECICGETNARHCPLHNDPQTLRVDGQIGLRKG